MRDIKPSRDGKRDEKIETDKWSEVTFEENERCERDGDSERQTETEEKKWRY